MSLTEYSVPTAAAADIQLAEALEFCLRSAIRQRATASLAVSAGPTAGAWLRRLSMQDLDWTKVQVLLTDECWVDRSSEHSCEQRLRKALAQGNAVEASVVGLKTGDASPIPAVTALAERLARTARPFDAVVVNGGSDGSVAGLFADMPALNAMLDPRWSLPAAPATSPSAPVERMTLTLRSLLDTRDLFLIVRGAEALRAYEAVASEEPDTRAWPLTALLKRARMPVHVLLVEG